MLTLVFLVKQKKDFVFFLLNSQRNVKKVRKGKMAREHLAAMFDLICTVHHHHRYLMCPHVELLLKLHILNYIYL